MKQTSRALACMLMLTVMLLAMPMPAHASWRPSGQLPGTVSDSSVSAMVGVLVVVSALAIYLTVKRKMAVKKATNTEVFIKQVADPANKTPELAMEKLKDIGERAVVDVVALCKNTDPVIRCRAIAILSDIKDTRATTQVRTMLADKDSAVKIAALNGIAAKLDKDAVKGVEALTTDADPLVREAAQSTLAKLKK